ncbi:MAG: NAAT family transporter [Bdellovibrionales bacterium]|nr:NAAT family transporter [Bdellovibrionales bacterium]
MKDILTYFLYTYMSIFTIVNPLGTLPVYAAFTDSVKRDQAVRVARTASFVAFVLMILFALTGQFLFNFFSISIDGLRVVGGILLFLTGYDMLQGKNSRTKILSKAERLEIEEFAITPLAIPMICGPGAITVVIVLIQEANSLVQKSILFSNIALVCFANFLFLIGSKRILSLLGNSGNKVFFRLMGLIIMMIAVEYFFRGLTPYVQKIIRG